MLWGAGSGCTCGEAAPELGASGADVVEPPPKQLPTEVSDAGGETLPGPTSPPSRRCPPEMVDVAGEFCIDRYEANFVDLDAERPLSPYYHPTRAKTRSSYDHWARLAPDHTSWFGERKGHPPLLPVPPAWQLETRFEPRARSHAGVYPQGYLNGEVARTACQNAGKRLCREEEWVRACRGQDDRDFPYGDVYEPLVCNVAREHHPAALLHGNASENHRDPRLNLVADGRGPLLRRTGESPRCASRWGADAAYDMVGNLDEWIDDDSGVFLGGFYARQTERGCAARIGAHAIEYYDYSLGVRCCS